jgi:hypothetical protein
MGLRIMVTDSRSAVRTNSDGGRFSGDCLGVRNAAALEQMPSKFGTAWLRGSAAVHWLSRAPIKTLATHGDRK